ncbi:hypothetical protein [Imhoffiella purpurea]|uniref:Uncharacterized protein n=1 Tax=Imhoffiella purpurea TaxID=1249627 RepID=W9V4W8_9GAMM|nr:hypothetical protein [Imhoffiella purpurea]EXJ14593.1 hypothetical protein D779_2287 [Imhoffiella purpurea]
MNARIDTTLVLTWIVARVRHLDAAQFAREALDREIEATSALKESTSAPRDAWNIAHDRYLTTIRQANEAIDREKQAAAVMLEAASDLGKAAALATGCTWLEWADVTLEDGHIRMRIAGDRAYRLDLAGFAVEASPEPRLSETDRRALKRLHRIAANWNDSRLDDALFDAIDLAMARDGCAELVGRV